MSPSPCQRSGQNQDRYGRNQVAEPTAPDHHTRDAGTAIECGLAKADAADTSGKPLHPATPGAGHYSLKDAPPRDDAARPPHNAASAHRQPVGGRCRARATPHRVASSRPCCTHGITARRSATWSAMPPCTPRTKRRVKASSACTQRTKCSQAASGSTRLPHVKMSNAAYPCSGKV